ncbi:hypothetical protein H5V45_12355 [Nocardioides sp. KIGAM211]|uniref:Uncharacterized protein n=1 Tax=Nocardioides luti TaxID=2761101 RepID=A0A7X0RH57_9ACTN|nr:hypothetical protein [Nocardioides luti]MBB6628112.1 hypothetical protein [Nocardioides luti]
MTRLLAGTVATATASALLVACSTSPASLERATADLPGVVRVRAQENDGDDDIPFAEIPKYLTITMTADASAAQVMDVFDAYGGEIDDGSVESVEVTLEGSRHATLATGAGIHADRTMVDDLVAAQRDAGVVRFRREAYPVLPNASIRLDDTATLDEVVAVADRYAALEEIEAFDVAAGPYRLSLDTANGSTRLYEERMRLTRRLAARFRLLGVEVSSDGPMEIAVAASDRKALDHLLRRSRGAASLGRVEVRTVSAEG